MISSRHHRRRLLPETPWRPPPYSLADVVLALLVLAILIPLLIHALEVILRGTP